MSLLAIFKHPRLLEHVGLIERSCDAQWRPFRLQAGPLKDVADRRKPYRRFWDESLDRRADYLLEVKIKSEQPDHKT